MSAASLDVAQYYAAKRGVPAANLCPVNFADTTFVQSADWINIYQPAIRSCLTAAGSTNILYVLMSYQTPFNLYHSATQFGFAAVDSYIADIWNRYSTSYFWQVPTGQHGYYNSTQSQGNVYRTFQTLAAYRASSRAQLIYSVWRLDGGTVALVKAMIDKASAAEAAGGVDAAPGGVAYFDGQFDFVRMATSFDNGYLSGDIDLLRAGEASRSAGFTTVEDNQNAEIGVAPAPLTAPNAMLFCGWYGLGTYNNVFTWRDGAVGWHLDSASAADPRIGNNWMAASIRAGITVTTGSVNEPYLEGLVHPDGAVRDLLAGANVGDAFLRNAPWLRWMILNAGDPLYRPFPGGRAPFTGVLNETSLTFSPRAVIGGRSTTATLTLANPAPSGGSVVTLSPFGMFFNMPATVTVPANQRSVTFTVGTNPVTQAGLGGVIQMGLGGTQITQNSLAVYPLLGEVAASPATAKGGTNLSGRVALYERASASTIVTLTSSDAALQVPPSVTVPLGASVAAFPITTSPVAADKNVTITATYAGTTVTFVVKLTP